MVGWLSFTPCVVRVRLLVVVVLVGSVSVFPIYAPFVPLFWSGFVFRFFSLVVVA